MEIFISVSVMTNTFSFTSIFKTFLAAPAACAELSQPASGRGTTSSRAGKEPLLIMALAAGVNARHEAEPQGLKPTAEIRSGAARLEVVPFPKPAVGLFAKPTAWHRAAANFSVKAALSSVFLALFTVPFAAAAATGNGDRVAVPLSDPARPAFVKAHLLNGSIVVKGYEGKEVVVEARARAGEDSDRESAGGMHRIPINSTGLEVEEENN